MRPRCPSKQNGPRKMKEEVITWVVRMEMVKQFDSWEHLAQLLMHGRLILPKQEQHGRLGEADGHTAGMLVSTSLMLFLFSDIQSRAQYDDHDHDHYVYGGVYFEHYWPCFSLGKSQYNLDIGSTCGTVRQTQFQFYLQFRIWVQSKFSDFIYLQLMMKTRENSQRKFIFYLFH